VKQRRCWSCGAQILPATARRNLGRCRPCAKKGWYGRLWEIVTGTGPNRRRPQRSPHVSDLRKALGLPPTNILSLDGLFSDLEREHIAARVDWRSEPEEILSEFRQLPNWTEPKGDSPDASAERVVAWLAHAERSRGMRLVNLEPGTDGWLLVILSPDQVSAVTKLAKSAGLGKLAVL
jgi:hypothetical protein